MLLTVGYLHEIAPGRLLNEINVNCVPMTILSGMVIQRMLQREQRSAIINISSVAGQNPCPFISTYSATKAYNDFFSKSIGMEYDGTYFDLRRKDRCGVCTTHVRGK